MNERHAGTFSLDSICRLSGITRQAYYKHFSYQHQSRGDYELVLEWVKEIRTHQPHLGVHKLYRLLKEHLQQHHIKMGRDALYDLLASENLLVKKKRRKATITTNSKHWFRKYKNLITGMQIVRPKQVWVSDITYIHIENGFLYLSLITDAYSRRIMGFCLADNLDAANSILALEMALEQLEKGEGKALIHHSDRGIQYCCTAYVKKLKRHGVAISMTETGDPLDNAIAERMNRTIKEELLDHLSIQSLEDGWEKIERAVWIYNYERPHMSLGMLTPHIAHTEKAVIKKYWKKEIVN